MRETARTAYDEFELNSRVSDVRVSYSDAASAREQAALAALTRRMQGRGFTCAAQQHKQEMESMEEEARTISPNHYRWDEFCADGRGDQFRHGNYLGRQVMDVDDFAAYFETCRTRRPLQEAKQTISSREAQVAAVPARTREESSYSKQAKTALIERKHQSREQTTNHLIALAKDWLQPDDPMLRRRGQKRTLPVSMIATLVVIAVSLMLIVSSSVMVAGAKRDVSNLNDKVDALSKEAELLTDRLDAEIDYLEIYRIATEQYGMVPAGFVNSIYVDKTQGNTVESFENEEEETLGLSTLLSAIGIHFGSDDES
jgi:hypothetical protein